jgi:hypothetical protein
LMRSFASDQNCAPARVGERGTEGSGVAQPIVFLRVSGTWDS